jgi:uncharacterized membrane protein
MSYYAVINFLHLLATVFWIGGMIFMNLILYPAQINIAPSDRGKFMGAVAKKFSIFAWLSVIVLIITGLIKTPEGMLVNTSTHLGFWLTIKHILILLMIVFGLIISLHLAPRIQKLAPKPGEQPSKEFINNQNLLSKFSVTNMIFGIGVLFVISILKF